MAKITAPPARPRTLIKRGAPISDMALDGWGRPLRPFSCHSGLDCKALRLHPPAPEERPLAAPSLPLVKKPCCHFASPTILYVYDGPEDGRIGPAEPGCGDQGLLVRRVCAGVLFSAPAGDRLEADWKSTRLNSSHLVI